MLHSESSSHLLECLVLAELQSCLLSEVVSRGISPKYTILREVRLLKVRLGRRTEVSPVGAIKSKTPCNTYNQYPFNELKSGDGPVDCKFNGKDGELVES